MWYKVMWIDPLFAAFNAVFPQRTKASDGTIGDPAHEEEVSGHNPDDTPGVQAERSDADTIPEVRAADVTSDFRDPRGIKMYDVVQRMLLPAYRAELNRLIYIICDGYIWKKSNGWVREIYYGRDKHFGHGHFSGDPASDNDSNPWNSILSIKDIDMDMSTPVPGVPGLTVGQYMADDWRWNATLRGLFPVDSAGKPLPRTDDRFTEPTWQGTEWTLLQQIKTAVAALATGGITQEMINTAMVHALQQPEVLAALAPVIQDNAFAGAQRAEQE